MSIPNEFRPLGTLGNVEFVDYAKFSKTVNCTPLEGLTSSDTTRLRTVVEFYCSALTADLEYDSVFQVTYPNKASGRWMLYHDIYFIGKRENKWLIENNTDIYQTTPNRNYPLLIDSDNTIDIDTNRAILNGTTITTRASGAPYTKTPHH